MEKIGNKVCGKGEGGQEKEREEMGKNERTDMKLHMKSFSRSRYLRGG